MMAAIFKRIPRIAQDTIVRPFQEFTRIEASGGIILIACTMLALLWANSPWAASYFALWRAQFDLVVGTFALDHTLHFWVNDGLMTIFFFVVGLEVKREFVVGELASPARAALPIAAALGGMVVPAILYLLLNAGKSSSAGWGIPMATDIAFAIGVLTLLGARVPGALKIFLIALAIVDDIGAVLVIAVFYTAELSVVHLAVAGAILLLLVLVNVMGFRRQSLYVVLGVVLWLAMLGSGVHPTIAGVLVAMTIPVLPRTSTAEFLQRVQALIHEFEGKGVSDQKELINEGQQSAILALEQVAEEVQTPLQRMEHALHPWVTYAIMPLFAFSNAGVMLDTRLIQALTGTVSLGIIVGLVVGKPVGITLLAWIATRLGLAALPKGVRWRQLYCVSWLGGIGFTMSLFIATLAFGESTLLSVAKVGILFASLIAGIVGYGLLRFGLSGTPRVSIS
jgi:NhaA family Na+:H+ antiporter